MAVPDTLNYAINAVLLNQSWTGTTGLPTVVRYAYGDAAPSSDARSLNAAPFGTTANDMTFRLAVDSAMRQWSSYANITFNREVSGAASPLLIGHTNATLDADTAGITYLYDESALTTTVDVIVSTDYAGVDLARGQYGYFTVMHELGHAIGLDHPFEYPLLPSSLDKWDYSLMSYTPGTYATLNNTPVTPMLYDIAALQYLYGANTATHGSSGSQHGIQTGEGAYTIWDGGGADDVLHSSGYAGNVTLDLREGEFHVNQVGTTAVWLAFGSNIEHAVSGAGNDVLQGNTLANALTSGAGNDTLNGYAGGDVLQGNTGNDNLQGGTGNDTVFGGQNEDVLRGGQDNDLINGNLGNDTVYGDLGDDTLRGGQGQDSLFGGAGNDQLIGDRGNDTLQGDSGADRFIFENAEAGNDRVADFTSGSDLLHFSPTLFASAETALAAFSGSAFTLQGGATITVISTSTLTVSDILIG